jgi:hypothetical protein
MLRALSIQVKRQRTTITMRSRLILAIAATMGLWGVAARAAETVSEPERTVPLIQDVDVVVVGGTRSIW